MSFGFSMVFPSRPTLPVAEWSTGQCPARARVSFSRLKETRTASEPSKDVKKVGVPRAEALILKL